MKKISLVGKLLTDVPAGVLTIQGAEYFAAPGLSEVQQIFEKNNSAIHIVIMGAGIELEKRLEIAKYVFKQERYNNSTYERLGNRSGGFCPFCQ